MMEIQTSTPDKNWLEPEELYLDRGEKCEIDRPLFQGDVFSGVRLPILPKTPVQSEKQEIDFADSRVMVIPHPCQCYHGDNLRRFITVAPVSAVANYENFGADYTGNKDKFALPDLLCVEGSEEYASHIADFGRIISIPNAYLPISGRIACLSHMGIGLLSKRFIQFQSRVPSELAQVMAFTQDQWNESFLMQAWVRKFGSLKGFTKWCKLEQVIQGLNKEIPLAPRDYLISALDLLIEAVGNLPSGARPLSEAS